jgi:hypothetical protein
VAIEGLEGRGLGFKRIEQMASGRMTQMNSTSSGRRYSTQNLSKRPELSRMYISR